MIETNSKPLRDDLSCSEICLLYSIVKIYNGYPQNENKNNQTKFIASYCPRRER